MHNPPFAETTKKALTPSQVELLQRQNMGVEQSPLLTQQTQTKCEAGLVLGKPDKSVMQIIQWHEVATK